MCTKTKPQPQKSPQKNQVEHFPRRVWGRWNRAKGPKSDVEGAGTDLEAERLRLGGVHRRTRVPEVVGRPADATGRLGACELGQHSTREEEAPLLPPVRLVEPFVRAIGSEREARSGRKRARGREQQRATNR